GPAPRRGRAARRAARFRPSARPALRLVLSGWRAPPAPRSRRPAHAGRARPGPAAPPAGVTGATPTGTAATISRWRSRRRAGAASWRCPAGQRRERVTGLQPQLVAVAQHEQRRDLMAARIGQAVARAQYA